MLTHEAFHLRRWRFRRNEGKVECQAIVYFKDAAQRLGATAEQAEQLYPYALALMGVCSWLLHRGFRRNHWL